MRITTRTFGRPVESDWTPMIDMTFQLIAFFMFTLNFGQADQDERIKLPASELAKPSENVVERPLTLQLTEQGTVIFGGEEMPLAELHEKLRAEREILDRLGKSTSSVTMIVRADGRAETGRVQELIKACQDRGFERFSLRAMQKQKEPQS